MRRDQHVQTTLEVGDDFVDEIRDGALGGHLETLSLGRGHIVGAAPHVHLLGAVLLGSLGLVQTLQGAVVALVQPPVVSGRHIIPRGLIVPHDNLSSPLSANQIAGVDDVKPDVSQLKASLIRLFDALLRQIDIGPAGEAIGRIPDRLTMPNQNQSGHRRTPGLHLRPAPRFVELQATFIAPGTGHQQDVLSELPLGLA